MRPVDIQAIGSELAIKWDDGGESYVALRKLREACPCAACKGERDLLGRNHKGPDLPLLSTAFRIVRIVPVGKYAVQPVWADGHDTGFYSFDFLRRLADTP